MKEFFRKIKIFCRKYISPVFILFLLLSTTLWYLTKMSYTYTSSVPVEISIGGNDFKVYCVAEGVGYRLFSHKVFRKKKIVLGFRDIQTTPSVINQGYFVVNSYSLQNAISLSIKDLKIISVGNMPEISSQSNDL